MDMAFLNGFMAAQRLPTQDTWLSGYGVPYYYFGYFVAGVPGQARGRRAGRGLQPGRGDRARPGHGRPGVAGVEPGARGGRAGGVVRGRRRRAPRCWRCSAATCSTFFEFLLARGWSSSDAGDVLGIKHFGEASRAVCGHPTNGFWWFNASRVIPNLQPDGINEFPFFSAFLSDLHPHFVALPFELLVLAAAAAHVLSRGATLRSPWTQGLAALSLGGLLVINTWDIAPFWLLYVGAEPVRGVRSSRGAGAGSRPSRRRSSGAALSAPYFVGYSGPPLGLGIVRRPRTPFGSLLVLFGWAIVLLARSGCSCAGASATGAAGLIAGVGRRGGRGAGDSGPAGARSAGRAAGDAAALAGRARPLRSGVAALAVGIGAFAAAMLLGVELIFLDDVFHSRMNTVFKFHENAWLLAGLAAGVGVALIGRFTLRARWVVSALRVRVRGRRAWCIRSARSPRAWPKRRRAA